MLLTLGIGVVDIVGVVSGDGYSIGDRIMIVGVGIVGIDDGIPGVVIVAIVDVVTSGVVSVCSH